MVDIRLLILLGKKLAKAEHPRGISAEDLSNYLSKETSDILPHANETR
jgi:hypothetical protein